MKIKKVYADALTTLAKGTDAGIYRLNPKRVEIVSREQDVKRVLAECEKTGKSVTFKAGGTSLSGQTITDSVLMEISPDYGKVKISVTIVTHEYLNKNYTHKKLATYTHKQLKDRGTT